MVLGEDPVFSVIRVPRQRRRINKAPLRTPDERAAEDGIEVVFNDAPELQEPVDLPRSSLDYQSVLGLHTDR